MSMKKKVFVGMSGGVDSSVSALLLKQAGYEVTGVFIKVWQADFLPCTWRDERRDAMRVAAHLGIPFITLDLEREYKEEVVDYMIREYREGRVPNPDVMCNKYVKFGAFYTYARAHGADFIATGHYATTKQVDGHTYLAKSEDEEKDQTYFLWTLNEEILEHTFFPVGGMTKNDVREIATKYGLPNAEKKDSQGLCFIGKVDMRDFLKHYLNTTQGEVLDEAGNIIGTHEGAMLYTIGQRHGFTIENTKQDTKPYYVVSKHIEHNTITVSETPHANDEFIATGFSTNTLHAVHPQAYTNNSEIDIRIRYRGELHPGTIAASGTGGEVKFTTPTPQVTIGQSAVFYKNDLVLGGAVIDKVSHG